jgi:hypothetical protein
MRSAKSSSTPKHFSICSRLMSTSKPTQFPWRNRAYWQFIAGWFPAADVQIMHKIPIISFSLPSALRKAVSVAVMWAHCRDNMSSSNAHTPRGLHRLLHGRIYFISLLNQHKIGSKSIPITDHIWQWSCAILWIPHCLDNLLTGCGVVSFSHRPCSTRPKSFRAPGTLFFC